VLLAKTSRAQRRGGEGASLHNSRSSLKQVVGGGGVVVLGPEVRRHVRVLHPRRGGASASIQLGTHGVTRTKWGGTGADRASEDGEWPASLSDMTRPRHPHP
jgi:hypothetical protein